MGNDTEDLMDLLSTTTEDRLQSFISKKMDTRIAALKERRKRLSEELAAIDHEISMLNQYSQGGDDAPTPQEVLARLLKGK